MPEISLSWQVLIPSVIAITVFFVFVVGKAVQSLRSKTTTGNEGLVGETGSAATELAPRGQGVCPRGNLARTKQFRYYRRRYTGQGYRCRASVDYRRAAGKLKRLRKPEPVDPQECIFAPVIPSHCY